jgi:sugar lactone lactonase YvrE
MRIPDPTVVLNHKCTLGEGPVWDAEKQRLLWVDIQEGVIHQYDPESGSHRIFETGKLTGFIVLTKNGKIIAGLQDGFSEIDLENGSIGNSITPDNYPNTNRFNDGKCDPEGRLWAGTMSIKDDIPNAGKLYMLDTERSVSIKLEPVTISNGLAWSGDEKLLYYIDTPTNVVVAFNYDGKTASIKNKRTIITFPENFGHPDGMTIDAEGMLWIAFWDGWKIARFNPDNGKMLNQINLPVARVTCCTFGGKNLDDLYVTTASIGLTEKQMLEQPLAGKLFVIKNAGVKGLPPNRFKG